MDENKAAEGEKMTAAGTADMQHQLAEETLQGDRQRPVRRNRP